MGKIALLLSFLASFAGAQSLPYEIRKTASGGLDAMSVSEDFEWLARQVKQTEATFSALTAVINGKANSFTGISPTCPTGYYLDHPTYTNGILTGGVCTAIPLTPVLSYVLTSLDGSSSWLLTIDTDGALRTAGTTLATAPVYDYAINSIDGTTSWQIQVDDDGALQTVQEPLTTGVVSIPIFTATGNTYQITVADDGPIVTGT